MSVWSAMFARDATEGSPLPPIPADAKGCGECPADNMYAEIVEALALEPESLRGGVLARWFCHCNPGRRCVGATRMVERKANR